MYGQPLEPNRTKFYIRDNSRGEYYGSKIQLFLVDMDDEENDDVREVNHPEWGLYWENDSENEFSAIDEETVKSLIDSGMNDTLKELGIGYSEDFTYFKTIKEAREWLLSIGMIESEEDLICGG